MRVGMGVGPGGWQGAVSVMGVVGVVVASGGGGKEMAGGMARSSVPVPRSLMPF